MSTEVYLNLYEIDGLHKPGCSGEHAGVQNSPCRGDDLSTSSVDGISVKSNVVDVESNTAHVFVTEDTLKHKT